MDRFKRALGQLGIVFVAIAIVAIVGCGVEAAGVTAAMTAVGAVVWISNTNTTEPAMTAVGRAVTAA
jgi:hypothetical protein